jgi:hypothetical protein
MCHEVSGATSGSQADLQNGSAEEQGRTARPVASFIAALTGNGRSR